MTHIKTTIDLPDELLIAAKQVAAQRRTTLRDIVMRSLRREIGLDQPPSPSLNSPFEVGPLGIVRLKKVGAATTAEDYQALIEQVEREDDEYHSRPPSP